MNLVIGTDNDHWGDYVVVEKNSDHETELENIKECIKVLMDAAKRTIGEKEYIPGSGMIIIRDSIKEMRDGHFFTVGYRCETKKEVERQIYRGEATEPEE